MVKLVLATIILLSIMLAIFTIPSWLAILSGEDGYNVVMTSYIGKFEQVMDVLILTTAQVLGIISTIWLFKFIYG